MLVQARGQEHSPGWGKAFTQYGELQERNTPKTGRMETTNQRHIPSGPTRTRPETSAARSALCGSILYLMAALAWLLSGRQFPMGAGDAVHADGSWLSWLGWPAAAILMVTLAAAAIAVAGMIINQSRRSDGMISAATVKMVGIYSLVLLSVSLLLVVDQRVLMLLGYLPMVLFGWFHEPFRDAMLGFDWPPVIHQAMVLGAAAFWVRLAFLLRRAARPAASPPLAAFAGRWGATATGFAVAVPLVYATTRLFWAAGVPLGITDAFLAELKASRLEPAELTLGGMAIAGALLTMGLTQRWGEIFPRWMPGLADRPVPVAMAVAPAAIVSLAVFSAGVPVLAGAIGVLDGRDEQAAGSFLGAVGPMLLFIPWALALALATYAYWVRRTSATQFESSPSGEQEAKQ